VIAHFIFFFLTQSSAQEIFSQIERLAANHEQVIVATQKKSGFVSLYQKINGKFRKTWGPVPAVFGKNGIAKENAKVEGDGKTPSGIFEIEGAFGYHANATTKLNYRTAGSNDKWIDDVESSDYNNWVHGDTTAKSFEKLKRDDNLYEHAFITSYNRTPVIKGKGSAIFVHVWRGPNSTTAGCVAIAKENMLYLLDQLDRSRKPAILISKDL